MIVGPNKGVFFLGTALMCSAALYAAEPSSPIQDPLRRIFVGEPSQLTVPPGFPEAFPETTAVSVGVGACDAADTTFEGVLVQSASTAPPCTKPTSAPIILPGPLTGVSTEEKERTAPLPLSTTLQAH